MDHCDVKVTNVDTFNDPLVVTALSDEVKHPCPAGSTGVPGPNGGCLFDVLTPTTVFGSCVAGSGAGGRCRADADCGTSGDCDLNLRCLDPVSPVIAGAPTCSNTGASCAAGKLCLPVLSPPPGPANIIVATHTDTLGAGDSPVLFDMASTSGVDTGQNPGDFDLIFPSRISVSAIEPIGCRITGGGVAPDGTVDLSSMATTFRTTFGGQVGAPCGCFGCNSSGNAPDFTKIQGNWTHMRKSKNGSFKATDFNSLTCRCTDPNVPAGQPCPPAEHPTTPADRICVTGRGEFNPTGSASKGDTVAFRLDAMDGGEPGVMGDTYRLRMWMPRTGETVEQLAQAACCASESPVIRAADIDDGGNLLSGNIQIHRALAKSFDGPCPPPSQPCR